MRVLAALLGVVVLHGCAVEAAPGAAAVPPARPERVVSLDFCADQFVLQLADRDQIAALSVHSESGFSHLRQSAGGLAQVRDRAEEVLALRPDLVVRAYGGGASIGGFLDRADVPLAQLAFGEDFETVRANVRAMAKALGHPERGEALVQAFDARLGAIPGGEGVLEALYLTPAGVTTGEGSLAAEAIRAAGLANFQRAPGWRPLPLERLAREQPDLAAASFYDLEQDPQTVWSAARHPLARRLLRERPVVQLEGAWTACGGWFIIEAVEALSRARLELEASAHAGRGPG